MAVHELAQGGNREITVWFNDRDGSLSVVVGKVLGKRKTVVFNREVSEAIATIVIDWQEGDELVPVPDGNPGQVEWQRELQRSGRGAE